MRRRAAILLIGGLILPFGRSLPLPLPIGYTNSPLGWGSNANIKPRRIMPKRRKKNSTTESPYQASQRNIDTQKRIADMTPDEYRRLATELQQSLNGRRGVKR